MPASLPKRKASYVGTSRKKCLDTHNQSEMHIHMECSYLQTETACRDMCKYV
jgi:hypothetical protein